MVRSRAGMSSVAEIGIELGWCWCYIDVVDGVMELIVFEMML